MLRWRFLLRSFQPRLAVTTFPPRSVPLPGTTSSPPPQSSSSKRALTMSDSQEQTWSDSPNAPKIPYSVYLDEKADFAGMVGTAILYGMYTTHPYTACLTALTPFARFILGVLLVLFFQCIAALFNPVNRKREDIKWGLVSYTVTMFSFATILIGMSLHVESLSYIDNREIPGVEGAYPPGPTGYPSSIWLKALSVTPRLMFLLNNWLADGLLASPLSNVALAHLSV